MHYRQRVAACLIAGYAVRVAQVSDPAATAIIVLRTTATCGVITCRRWFAATVGNKTIKAL